jgi:hypothetical protein
MPISVPVFQKFQVEAAIIGRLVVGYGELEVDLCNCVAMGISNFDKAFKAMFRTRNATDRIKIAERLGRESYAGLDLGDGFDEAIIGMRYCVRIRNQYAHRNFYDDNAGTLGFVNLEELAGTEEIVNDLLCPTVWHVTSTLLEEQEAYFVYVRATIGFLHYEGRLRSGKIKANPFDPPEKLVQPPPLALDAESIRSDKPLHMGNDAGTNRRTSRRSHP